MPEIDEVQHRGVPYLVGRLIRRHPLWAAGVLVAAIGGCNFLGYRAEQHRATAIDAERSVKLEAEKKRLAAVASAEATLKAECAVGGKAHSEAAAQFKGGNIQAAYKAIKYCRPHLEDPTLKAFFLKVESASRKLDEADAARAAAAAARAAAVEKAAKRREGVRLGMSQQDALDSSWGKPDHINRTTTIRGVREQWVYRSRSRGYLYFENGILTSVQN